MPISTHKRNTKKQRRLQAYLEQENKIANHLDRRPPIKKTRNCTDSTKHKKPVQTCTNSAEFALSKQTNSTKKQNPFFRKINRHYGSFTAKYAGNYKSIFQSLPFKEIKPLGRTGTGCRRKLFKNASFSLVFFQNGTIEIRPSRNIGLLPKELQAVFFKKAYSALRLASKFGIVSLSLKMNRPPKYGYRDKTASLVKKEYRGKFRGMDATPDPFSIDNNSCKATERDLRLSDEQNFRIARARADNPEVIASIESRLSALIDCNLQTAQAAAELGRNMKTHVKIMKRIDLGLWALSKAIKPKRVRMPTAFKASATVRGIA